MSEKFNSGHGGYTCDGCSILLWSGHLGSKYPENRFYYPEWMLGFKIEDIEEIDNKFFCPNCVKKFYPF